MTDEQYMKIALQEAVKGMGYTSPNPMVGAVIVKDGRIISRDYHHKWGEFHAERNAVNKCPENMTGAHMYVTLEPCCHEGKTPPCTQSIIDSGIKRVCVGSFDPNPLVAGKGIETLRAKGIEVKTGVLKEECDSINEVFFHYIINKTPYVVMKYALSADGKTACSSGNSKWISNELSREHTHLSRMKYSGIMIGVNTVIKDDPSLTCRLKGGRNPIRIICDTNLKTPLDSRIVKTAGEVPTIIACREGTGREEEYEKRGVKLLKVGVKEGHVDLHCLMNALGELKIDSILLEGGAALNYSALEAGIVKKVQAYIAPKIIGGEKAPSAVGGVGVLSPGEAFFLKKPKVQSFGEDIMIEWEVDS